MKTYLIDIEGNSVYIKSDANSEVIQSAINFTPKGEKYVERLLQAIRITGHKATEIKLDIEDIFEVS